MNIDNLYKIFELYLKKENENKVILTITKFNDYVQFSFSMTNHIDDLTNVNINKEDVDVDLLIDIIKRMKENLLVIDDKYDFNRDKNICKYESIFNTGRKIVFKNFKLEEINLLRNAIYNIDIYDTDMRVITDNKEQEIPYNLRLRESGFSSYMTIFLVALGAIDIIVIILWIFKHLS